MAGVALVPSTADLAALFLVAEGGVMHNRHGVLSGWGCLGASMHVGLTVWSWPWWGMLVGRLTGGSTGWTAVLWCGFENTTRTCRNISRENLLFMT